MHTHTHTQSDGFLAAGTRGGSVKIYDLNRGKAVRTLKGHRAASNAIAFHPYGSFLVTGSRCAATPSGRWWY